MRNIYQAARESAELTQERAAELIGLSVESIRSYESGKRVPNDDAVIKMVDIYWDNYLAYEHLKHKTQVGNVVLPDVKEVPLSQAALQMINSMNQFIECESEIVQITMDGIIDKDEEQAWLNIMKKCRGLHKAVLTLQYSKKGGDRKCIIQNL